jgi:xylan 1,4-beta-xylosidase
MTDITNPILPGFHPDPSICRVGDDYYIASSTFEWLPGVRIHHSRDLTHWRPLTYALERVSLLDMRGNPDSGGIWAPCLSYADGLFWLIYTDVKTLLGPFKDTPNYLTTAPAITGPWSEPVFLNASGFDPSLFHDDDGRKWLTNMIWDYRAGHNRFAGIAMQEYSVDEHKLVGPITTIFRGTALGVTEGPHLYKKDGWYYLMTAEGGTGPNHAVTMARSRTIRGPYEVDPANPMLTSRGRPELRLHKAGHASLVDTRDGEWYLVHLCSRPIGPHGRCMLGRETAVQRCEWSDEGWLRLAAGGNAPHERVAAPRLPAHPFPPEPARDDFDGERLGVHLNTLRVFADESWCSLVANPGHLRLYGRESLSSRHAQSLVARRLQAFTTETTTCMRFAPTTFQQTAGLVAYYNTANWYYLCVSHDEQAGRVLKVMTMDNGTYGEPPDTTVPLRADCCHLRASIDHDTLRFAWSIDGKRWHAIGPRLDASTLSDDYVEGWGFTGAFVGLCCQDLSGQGGYADFDWFEYREL